MGLIFRFINRYIAFASGLAIGGALFAYIKPVTVIGLFGLAGPYEVTPLHPYAGAGFIIGRGAVNWICGRPMRRTRATLNDLTS